MPKPRKKFEEYVQEKPFQLNLFQFLEESALGANRQHRQNVRDYSQSIELYDFIPKYVWSSRKIRESNGMLPILMREFECRGIKRKLVIHPAGIVDEQTGEARYFYPGAREEIIEEVLRKLAVEGGGVFLDDQAGVALTIYQIRKELEQFNHKMSFDQIKESLKILALTRLELINLNDKRDSIIFSPIENLGLSGKDGETQTFVVFSPLVTDSIKKLHFRLYNYRQVMGYNSAIARQLHKRMAHHYKQASPANKYTISLTTIIRDFGISQRNTLRSNLQKVEKALEEMKAANVILNYQVEKTYDSRSKKILEAMLHLQPSAAFSSEVRKANQIETDNQKKLSAGSSSGFHKKG